MHALPLRDQVQTDSASQQLLLLLSRSVDLVLAPKTGIAT
jgi:hypothetical protein